MPVILLPVRYSRFVSMRHLPCQQPVPPFRELLTKNAGCPLVAAPAVIAAARRRTPPDRPLTMDCGIELRGYRDAVVAKVTGYVAVGVYQPMASRVLPSRLG